MSRSGRSRAQASLPALAIALLVLSSVTVLALGVADGTLTAADREPNERHVATSVADRLLAANGPVAVRQNVLDNGSLDRLDAERLRDRLAVVDDEAIRVTVTDRRIVADRSARGGTTVRRIVAVRTVENQSIRPVLGSDNTITLPRRMDWVRIEVSPANGTSISTVRANGRVLLRNEDGLSGEFTVDLSRFETVQLRFAGNGSLFAGDVTLEYPVERTTRATMAVTVDG